MKKKQHLFFTIPLFAVLCCTVLFLLMPFVLDRFLLPRLIDTLPFSEKEFSLSRISPWLVRGTLTLADDNHPTLAIPRFEVHSSPRDLLRGKITRLLIDSPSIEVDMRDGRPVIHGLPFSSSNPKQEEKPPAPILPVSIDTLIVKNLTLALRQDENRFINLTVSSRLDLEYSDLRNGRPTSIDGRIQTRGDLNLTVRGSVKDSGDGYEIDLHADTMDISKILFFFPTIEPINLAGALSVDAGARLNALGELTSYQATAQLSRFHCIKETVEIANSASAQPVLLTLSGDLTKSQFTLKNIAFTKPEKTVFALEGVLETGSGSFSGEGRLHPERTKSPVKVVFYGQKGPSMTRLKYQLETEKMHFDQDQEISPLTADGELLFSNSTISGDFNSRVASISIPSSDLKFVDVALKLPFVFPPVEGKRLVPGKFTIEAIHYRNIPSGRLEAEVLVAQDSIEFSSLLTTPFSSDIQLICTGLLTRTPDLTLGCEVPETFIDESALPPYVEVSEELAFGGKISAALNFNLHNGKPGGDLKVGFHDGNINFGTNNLKEINLDVTFPRLPLRQSGPGQLCTIGQADFGSIHLTDGRIRFRVEDERTLFLEKSKFNWCGGRVETTSFGLSTEMKELEATLYCDRLKFTELLGQFGIEDAEGEGSLNGRLPLFISSEGVVFDDGFLFSTPGNSGIVRFNNTAQLRQGIPSIDQSAYLDYSMRALENFSYNWTKLTFNSDLDQLLITMQLDGKPAEPLPFGYKNGTIVPTDKGPGLDHPIRLDVNFRLPLQEMFQYGKNIQSIMENM